MNLSRRSVIFAPAALVASAMSTLSATKMKLSIHQATSAGAGFRRSLEGWAKAGIKNVELSGNSLDEFLKRDTVASAARIIHDLGLTVVSAGSLPSGLWVSTSDRREVIEQLKHRCEQYAALGVPRIVCTTFTNKQIATDDYSRAASVVCEIGEIAAQYKITAMMEFLRNSAFISTLPTALRVIREAAHPSVRPMIDTFHFWAGPSKLEDLDLIRPGEIAHVHFEDIPDTPRELLTDPSRVIPGEGIAPLTTILRKLALKGYSGALSVELFAPRFQQGDPYEVAGAIREKAERVMRQADVL